MAFGANPEALAEERIKAEKGGDVIGAAMLGSDPVNHPSHYNASSIEPIDVIEDWELDFHTGNTVKYICRHNHKSNPLEDLKKAKWYLDRRIENLEKSQEQLTLGRV